MAEILPITANIDCDVLGGVAYAYATEYTNVNFDNITVNASGAITNIGMLVSGTWERLNFDDENDIAFFNETGELVNNSAVVYNGEGTMQFNGVSQYKIKAAGLAGACCGVVIIWVHYSGIRRVQGIDVKPLTASTFTASRSKKRARIVPSVNSGTGAESEVVIYATQHQGRYPSATTTLSDAAIEAL